jgi:predicted homoserine dehydrogenase-like protein
MIIVDRLLEERARAQRPIQVALIGAGFLGKGLAYHLLKYVPGIRVAGIFSRNLDNAAAAYLQAGIRDVTQVRSTGEVRDAIRRSRPVITTDASVLCSADGIDAVVEMTGSVSFGAEVAMLAIQNRKHVLLNAELDATLGPALKKRADEAGVTVTTLDGDQPGTELNLYRFVQGMGLEPLLCGNIKALLDPYRTPLTQRGFAERWKQNPVQCTSFADGSKISFEQAVVANATGMQVARRGMWGPRHDGHVSELTTSALFDRDELREMGGIVDYVIGSQPSPGVFVLATTDDAVERHYLDMYKMGPGPLYCFYAPYHLCHLEAPFSIARAVLLHDATATPVGPPVVDVVAVAKTDLAPGMVLDGIGGFTAYGQCENAPVVHNEGLLPLGLADGCEVMRPIARDQVIRYADVRQPSARWCDMLRAEQDRELIGDPEELAAAR